MCEYKNNKSEAFTAVISLISLYNSVACHETHTLTHTQTLIQQYMYIQRCTHTHTHAYKLVYSSLRWEESSNGHDTQVTSLVKDGKGEKVKTHAHKKEKIYISYIYHSQKVDSPPFPLLEFPPHHPINPRPCDRFRPKGL